jgi:hypothetical protein
MPAWLTEALALIRELVSADRVHEIFCSAGIHLCRAMRASSAAP